jgi:hypothetical protein
MGIFDDMLRDVGASVAAFHPAPPPAVDAAVQAVARAMLGEPLAAQKIRNVTRRSSSLEVPSLFGLAFRRLQAHPTFQHALSAAHLHHRPLPRHHPKAHVIQRGVQETMRELDRSLPGLLQALHFAKSERARLGPGFAAGGVHGPGAHGGAHTVHSAAAPAGTRKGPRGWRHRHRRREHPGEVFEPPAVFWGGPWGWGVDSILDEREELEEARSPDDLEPDWEHTRGMRGSGD